MTYGAAIACAGLGSWQKALALLQESQGSSVSKARSHQCSLSTSNGECQRTRFSRPINKFLSSAYFCLSTGAPTRIRRRCQQESSWCCHCCLCYTPAVATSFGHGGPGGRNPRHGCSAGTATEIAQVKRTHRGDKWKVRDERVMKRL